MRGYPDRDALPGFFRAPSARRADGHCARTHPHACASIHPHAVRMRQPRASFAPI
jgi:hypothetical protein